MTALLHACEVCRAKVSELRRGRCWGCYARWVDARPVGMGAHCITCNEKRHKVLRAVELFGGWQAMCFNCSGQLLHLEPLPETLAELREAVSRERRKDDRRAGARDTRVFRYERRAGQRRDLREEYPQIDDDMIVEIGFVDVDLGGFECDDLTSIRPLVVELA